MTIYSETSGLNLLTSATDPEGDGLVVYAIDGNPVATWPHTKALSVGSVSIEQDGDVFFDNGDDTTGSPGVGSTATAGTFTFTVWDGQLESATYTCTIDLTGVTVSGDVTPPSPVSMVPSRTATDQNGIAEIALTYSEPIQFAASGDVDIWNDTTDTLIETLTVASDVAGSGAGTMNISGSTIYVRPTSALPDLTQISLRIDGSVIEDLTGNPHTIGTSAGWWNFTTASGAGDVTPPVLQSMAPAAGSSNVSTSATVSLVFNEAVAFASSGTITLRNVTDNSTIETFDVVTDAGTGAGTVGITGATLLITPTAVFTNAKEISVQLSAGAIEDTAGNSHAGITNDSWSFTTIASGTGALTYSFGDRTPERQAGIPATSFTPDVGNHFELFNGKIHVTAAGEAAGLNAGPYSVTIDGSAETITIVTNCIHVDTRPELDAAITSCLGTPSTDCFIRFRDGSVINTGTTWTSNDKVMNGVFSDTNVISGGNAIQTVALADVNSIPVFIGGSITIDCDVPFGCVWFDWRRMQNFNGIVWDGIDFACVANSREWNTGNGASSTKTHKNTHSDFKGSGTGGMIHKNTRHGAQHHAPAPQAFYPMKCIRSGGKHFAVIDSTFDLFYSAFDSHPSAGISISYRNKFQRAVTDSHRWYDSAPQADISGTHYALILGDRWANLLGSVPGDYGEIWADEHADLFQANLALSTDNIEVVIKDFIADARGSTVDPTPVLHAIFDGTGGLPDYSGVSSFSKRRTIQGTHNANSGGSLTASYDYQDFFIIADGTNGLTVTSATTAFTFEKATVLFVLGEESTGPQFNQTMFDVQFGGSNGAVANNFVISDLQFNGQGNATLTNYALLDPTQNTGSQSLASNFSGTFVNRTRGQHISLPGPDIIGWTAWEAAFEAAFTPKTGSLAEGKTRFG